MAGTKEIRVKIASIKSTQKITKALEMVAVEQDAARPRTACAPRDPMRTRSGR